jgi:3-methyladenine DNA glycosylase/8-oxoguanine DNA glycosylase
MLITVGCDEPVFEFALELEEGFAEQPVKTDREETDKNRQKKLRSRANKFFMRDARLLHRPSPINKNLLSTLLASNFLS